MHPPVPCLGRTLLIHNVSKVQKLFAAGPPAADFGTASPCGGRLYGGPAAGPESADDPDAFGAFAGQSVQRKWPIRLTTSSTCCHRPEDVARACGLSRRAVYRAIARGELRAARLCHRLRVYPAELERWIAEETTPSASPAPKPSRRSVVGTARRGSLRALLDEATEA
jgi:excisionase family DNA binding protein